MEKSAAVALVAAVLLLAACGGTQPPTPTPQPPPTDTPTTTPAPRPVDDVTAAPQDIVITITATTSLPATERVIRRMTLPPSWTPTPTPTITLTRTPSLTPTVTQIPTITPTLTTAKLCRDYFQATFLVDEDQAYAPDDAPFLYMFSELPDAEVRFEAINRDSDEVYRLEIPGRAVFADTIDLAFFPGAATYDWTISLSIDTRRDVCEITGTLTIERPPTLLDQLFGTRPDAEATPEVSPEATAADE
ncbi:MAG: hypothetical protein ACOCX3_00500 [Chloroflexota bacterium]